MDEIEAVLNGGDMTFEEAVEYFRQRVPVTAKVFYSIAYDYRVLAFSVSGYSKLQILRRFYEELLAALEQGNTLAEFRSNMNGFLEREATRASPRIRRRTSSAPISRRPTMWATTSK